MKSLLLNKKALGLLSLGYLLFYSSFQSFAQIPAGYYNNAEGLSGYTLKTALHTIIKSGHQTRSYDELYGAYVNGDTDPEDNYVWDMYSENPNGADPYNYSHSSTDRCGNYSSEGDCYNREHLFPQGIFGSASPMKTDYHHVVPSDGKVNGVRSNFPFGEIDNPTWTSLNGSKKGSCSSPGYSGIVFEPIDEFKGDIARSLLYFATRYEDKVASWSHDMLDGTSDQVYADWFISVLLNWHAADPVSTKETVRNEAGYDFQGNRNPFIDHPEYVNSIWGGDAISSITNVVLNPLNPDINEEVSISATITDSEGVKNAKLKWGFNANSLDHNISMNSSSNNTYSTATNIPGHALTTEVFYQIEVIDNTDLVTSTPIYSYTVGGEIPILILLDEDFEGITANEDISLLYWTNKNEVGTNKWKGLTYNNNSYAQATSYQTSEENTIWLITPNVSLTSVTKAKLEFDINLGFYQQNGLSILISSDFTGNVSTANWEDITNNFTIPTTPTTGYGIFNSAGSYTFSESLTNVFVAFKYVGSSLGTTTNTTTYQIDNVLISGEEKTENTDTFAPILTYSPANDEQNVASNKPITINSNEPLRNAEGAIIDAAYLQAVFNLNKGSQTGEKINFSASINALNNEITLVPNTILTNLSTYFLTLNANSIADTANNIITESQIISFSTSNAEDVTAPTLLSSQLSANLNKVSLVFNEEIKNNQATYTLLKNNTKVSYDGVIYEALAALDTIIFNADTIQIGLNTELKNSYNKFIILPNSLKDNSGNAISDTIFSNVFDASGSDSLAPEFTTDYPQISNITTNTFRFTASLNEPCLVYYKIQSEKAAPTIDELLKGEYFKIDTANKATSIVIGQLTEYTNYNLYYVAADLMPKANVMDQIGLASVKTKGNIPVILKQPEDTSVCLNGNVLIVVKAQSSSPLTYEWYLNNTKLDTPTNDTISFINAGTENAGAYKCIVKNEFGETQTKKAIITIVDKPFAGADSATTMNDTVLAYDLRLLLSKDADNSGDWVDVDDSRAMIDQVFYPNLSGVGTFKFKYIVENNCFSDTAELTITIKKTDPSGVNIFPNQIVNIFPNPNSGNFTITINSSTYDCAVKIFTIDGKCVNFSRTNTENTINISVQKPGIYFIQITKGNALITKKVIVQE